MRTSRTELNAAILKGKITLSEALKEPEHASLYAINTSQNSNAQQRGELWITVNTGHKDIIVNVPNTWIPIDLTSLISRKDILTNPDFRRFINLGIVTLISTEVAETILDHPESRNEVSLLRIKNMNSSDTDRTAAIVREGLDNSVADSIHKRQLAAGKGFEEGVTPQVLTIAERPDISDSEMLTALNNIEDIITEKDLHYIIGKVDARDHPKVLTFARNGLESFNT